MASLTASSTPRARSPSITAHTRIASSFVVSVTGLSSIRPGTFFVRYPTPRTEDDLAKVDIARAQYRQVVGHLGRTFSGQLSRFEKAMIDGRYWHAGTWRRTILGHPVLTHFARTLVWGIRDDNGDLKSDISRR